MHTLRARTARIGFEIELLAPAGSSRRTLADELARVHRGRVQRVFHVDSEPSLVPGMGQFWHLTPGYRVDDAAGTELATLVDDITIVADLRGESAAAADPDMFRILSDDLRLLRLAGDSIGARTTSEDALEGVAAVFGVSVETVGAVRRVRDRTGASIAMSTALAPGRERPCEIVTPPIVSDHAAALETLLGPARALGFRVPVEGAVHLHVDGGPFRTVPAFANLVRLFTRYRDALHVVLRTNADCVRIGALPATLMSVVDQVQRSGADWPRLQAAVRELRPTKYLDVNLTALLTDAPVRDTVEVRILPGSVDGVAVMRGAATVLALLDRCLVPTPLPDPPAGAPPEEALQRLLAPSPGGARERPEPEGP